MQKIISKTTKQTQELGEKLAKEILRRAASAQGFGEAKAVVLGLHGNLGSGKTTFLQGFAKGLGIKEKILSPTFVIMKRFSVRAGRKNFYHIDCYRLKNEKDILELGWEKIISDPKNVVAVEWPEKIKRVLPKNALTISFKFIDRDRREIKFEI